MMAEMDYKVGENTIKWMNDISSNPCGEKRGKKDGRRNGKIVTANDNDARQRTFPPPTLGYLKITT